MISLESRKLERLTWPELTARRCDLLSAAQSCKKPSDVRQYVDRIEALNGEVRRRSATVYKRPRIKG
jgi:transcription elongation factor